ncbi:hypothetical protein AOXY_G33888, partial [Acipenser oxyrinchus oxyrinchus]
KRSRRSCGGCEACLRTTDCRTCDFCQDKPKFGGRNKKRQKCRLRQCQVEAMVNTIQYHQGTREPIETIDLDEEEDEGVKIVQVDDDVLEVTPVVRERDGERKERETERNGERRERRERERRGEERETGRETGEERRERDRNRERGEREMGEETGERRETGEERDRGEERDGERYEVSFSVSIEDTERLLPHDLLLFLDRIRQVPLPAHWVGLALEGPRIQLLQCSKLSTMSDTVVQIEPGFYYQITVQGQPLLLSHPLYERHPQRLLSVGDVIGLLSDLEGYRVCPGYPNALPAAEEELVMFVRAATCDLLVQSEERCDHCSVTPLVV